MIWDMDEYGIVMANADEEEKRKTDEFLKKWGADESDIEVRICTFLTENGPGICMLHPITWNMPTWKTMIREKTFLIRRNI